MSDVQQFVGPDIPCDKLDPQSDVRAVASSVLLSTLFKKWESESEAAETRALLTFLEANYLSEKWVLPELTVEQSIIIGEVRRELDDFLHLGPELLVNSFCDILQKGDIGPGAALGARGESFYAKLGASKLTATSTSLYTLYRAYVSMIPVWEEAESLRESLIGGLNIVDGSRVSFAPKNVDTARLICTEPSINMFCQLGLKAILEDRLKQRFNVDMAVQPDLNRLLAKIGSRDGSYATLDLSSASDSVSLRLCRELFPQWFFELLCELRSPKVYCEQYGLERELGMMSTMGNGFTFPVMTLILSCVVRAVYRVKGIPIRDNPRTYGDGYNVPGNWAVFGDDIIVSSDAYDQVVSTLQLFGFQTNVTKSFSKGPFRESCGHDYFSGVNIRGVYLKRLTSRQDVVIAVNLLNDWTMRTGVPLRAAVTFLLSCERNLPYVPYADPIDSGIRVPSRIFKGIIKGPKGSGGKICYQAFIGRPQKCTLTEASVKTPEGYKRLVYNGAAALLSLLRGELRNGKISLRQRKNARNLYQTRWCVTPYWDYMPTSVWVNPRTDWQRFETAVTLNMGNLEDIVPYSDEGLK